MKPIKLVICGWGPYRNKIEIDFTKLMGQGLFLITGATGAGKTTIFDAITYALYGNMSGGMREKGSVRSDFAKEDTPTLVELLMSHGKEQYSITRNPEYFRPKKRKSGKVEYTKEKENAILTLQDGTTIEGNGEVNRKLQEILILDYKQFKQITMIAQGEFAKLLVASPAEKMKIFREIFGTSIYERFTSSLKERANNLYQQVSEYQHKIEEDIHLFSLGTSEWEDLTKKGNYHYGQIDTYLKAIEKNHQKELEDSEKVIQTMEQQILKGTTQIQEIKQVNQIYERLRENCNKKQELDAKRTSIEALLVQIRQAEYADKVKSIEEVWKREKEAWRMLMDQKQEAQQQQERMWNQQQQLQPFYENRESLKEAVALLRELEKAMDNQRELGTVMEQKRKEFEKLQKLYLIIEQDTADKKNAYESAEKIYKRAVIGIVAKMIREGEPCLVCGSLEHPNIAPLSEEVPEEEVIEQLRLAYESSNQHKLEIYGQTVSKNKEVNVFQEQLLEIQECIQCMRLKQEGFLILSLLEKEQGKQADILEKKLEEYRDLQIRLEEKQAEIERLETQQQMQKDCVKQRKKDFEKSLQTYGFASVTEYQTCVKTEEFLKKSKEECKEFGEQERSIQDLIIHLEESVGGKKEQEESPILELLEVEKAKKEKELVRQTTWRIQLNEATKIRKSLLEKRKQMEKIEKEYGIIQDLCQVASGNNSKKLVFEQYVLAGYFEEILKAANLRFSKMTGERYELFRAEEVSDGRTKDNLEMLVMDFHTGKCRSVKTLSGGESFKASLSLALGMSDVIQANSGGIRVEALFIDEGFGALDSESLEQACHTLTSLVERDKIIGIISHVAELRERIDRQIIIEKSNWGSTVRVI